MLDTRIKMSIQAHDATKLKASLKLVRSLAEEDYTRYRVMAQQELYNIHRKSINYHPLRWGILSGISFVAATVIAHSDELFPQPPRKIPDMEMISMEGRAYHDMTIESDQADNGSHSVAHNEDENSSDSDNNSDGNDVFFDSSERFDAPEGADMSYTAETKTVPMYTPDIINTPIKTQLKHVVTFLRTSSSPISIGATALCLSTWLWQWRAQRKSLALEKRAQECITILEGSRNPIPHDTQTVLPE